MPAGPHEQDGLWMTLWMFVAHDAQVSPAQPRELGLSLRQLHAALTTSRVTWHRSARSGWLERLLAELPSPSLTRQDLDWLRSELDALTPAVFEAHCPLRRSMATPRRRICCAPRPGSSNDFEDVWPGVAWDISGS